ncbi:SPOR domain-containing protein [Leptobacterium flavescens]|uniref:SPOR domain-containing protein n=1 Tax=Leptobacterium flavescens TaxID=472055 RepID=A0A6P0UQR1_9FLAO|nr:SPOR domain-containing protein [Leptobacterium flavescens]NER13203.1 SPOR domain-containing protein [Leptobacterium flavescens]
MRVENYISDLLYRYQCVTVPGFGAFLTNKKPAQIHKSTNAFYPPTKELSFNAQLVSNDGLLAKHIAGVEGKSYEEVLEKLESLVVSWKNLLERKEKLSIKNIGELWLNDEAKIQFRPSYHLNYLTSSFGLSSFVSPQITREVLKEEVEEIEEKTPILFTPEKRTQRPYLRYAAIGLIALSLGAAGFKVYKDQEQKHIQLVDQKAQEKVEKTIQEATFFDADPLSLPSITLDVKKEVLKYQIVAGAFRIEANADKKVAQLRDKGYDAQRIGKNRFGLHQVVYASFTDVDEALSYLRKVKRTESRDAWLLVSE